MRKAATVTVTGWAGTTPREVSGDGVAFTSFRVSVAERRFDPRSGEWGDGPTEWFTVKAFRELARNVAESIRKGDPVVVTGRLRTEVWQADKGPQAGFVIEADAVGHDLTWGNGTFRRRVRRDGPTDGPEPRDPGSGGGGSDGPDAPAGPDEPVGAMPADPWAVHGPAPEVADAEPDDADLVRTP
jgi:single-strand DNA-binding protein